MLKKGWVKKAMKVRRWDLRVCIKKKQKEKRSSVITGGSYTRTHPWARKSNGRKKDKKFFLQL
jgi:hypothetical protein